MRDGGLGHLGWSIPRCGERWPIRRARGAADGEPLLEPLEERVQLAAVSWTGAAGDSQWATPGNWSNNAVPGAADDVTLDVPGTPTITFGLAAGIRTINSLLTRENITFTGGQLGVTGAATVEAGASINLAGTATINGGNWNVTAGTLRATSSSAATLNGPQITGELRVDVASAAVNLAGSTRFTTLRLLANGARANLANGYVVRDAIVADGAETGARIISNAAIGATASIAAGGSITIAPTSAGGLAIQNSLAGLTNSGTISNQAAGVVLTVQAGSFTNQGSVSASGGNVTISSGLWSSAAGGSLVVSAASTLTLGGNWSSSGTTTINGGTLVLSGNMTTAGLGLAGLSRTGGTISFIGNLNNTGATLALTATTGSISLAGGTITGGEVSFAGGATLLPTSAPTTLSSVNVLGDLVVAAASGAITIGGSTQFNALRLSGNASRVNIVTGYTLSRPVIAEGPAAGTRLIAGAATNTTLSLSPGSDLRIAPGSGAGLTLLASLGSVTNSGGTLSSLQAGQSISINSGSFSNATGTVSASAGNVVINSGTWSNAGVLSVGEGDLTLGGAWSNTGAIAMNGTGDLYLGGSFTTAGLNLPQFSRIGSNFVYLTGDLNNTGSTLTINAATGWWLLLGGSITGGSVGFAGGQFLAPTPNGGRLDSVTLTSTLDLANANAQITFAGTTSVPLTRLRLGGVRLLLASGHTLAGQVLIDGAGVGARIIGAESPGASVVIGPTGQITLGNASGGGLSVLDTIASMQIAGVVVNESSQDLTLGSASVQVLSSGEVRNSAGGSIITASGASVSNLGRVAVSAGRVQLDAGTLTNLVPMAGLRLVGGVWAVTGSGELRTPTAASAITSSSADVLLGGAGSRWESLYAVPGPGSDKRTNLAENLGRLTLEAGVRLVLPPGGVMSNSGTLALASTAELSSPGGFSQGASGRLEIDADDAAGIVRSGTISAGPLAALAGQLDFSYAGALLDRGESVRIMTAASVTGLFSTFTPTGAPDRGRFIVDYDRMFTPAGQLSLYVSDRRDVTGDGTLNLEDLSEYYTLYYQYFPLNAPWPLDVDWNRDGFLNLDDLSDYITDFYTADW
jgi:hypothetical protein